MFALGPRAALHHGAHAAPSRTSASAACRPTSRKSDAGSAGLVDILDRVLDKGLVVAGDIKVSLAEVELLTIRIRLMICSIDKAEQIGLDWWKYDRHLSPGREQVLQENLELREQLRLLEARESGAVSTAALARRDAGAGAEPTCARPRSYHMAVERAAGGTSLIDVLDRVLDKGIVIDAWVRVSLVGIDLITVEARVVVASIDTYLEVLGSGRRARPRRRRRHSRRRGRTRSSRPRTWRCARRSRAARRTPRDVRARAGVAPAT